MNKNEIIEKQKRYLFSCVATYYDEPLVVDHAKDNYVYDAEGKEFWIFWRDPHRQCRPLQREGDRPSMTKRTGCSTSRPSMPTSHRFG